MTSLSQDQVRARRVSAFITLADKELASARHLVSVAPEHAAYFLQQSVEKLLRAVLEHDAKLAGPSHNIRFLAELLTRDHTLYASFISFDGLSSASTRYRYPTELGDVRTISATEVTAQIDKLASLREIVVSHLMSQTGKHHA
jgi:HEPN domain-containing protein